MTTSRTWCLLSAVAVLAGGCQIISYSWMTPPSVAPGATFTMNVNGATDSGFGSAGVVFQIPNDFTVISASVVLPTSTFVPTLTRDDPALLALYTPDPGHYLASWSGQAPVPKQPTIPVHLTVTLQAPPVSGSHQIEMALAANNSGWQPQLGLGSFQLPGQSAVRTVQVTTGAAPFGAGCAATGGAVPLFDVLGTLGSGLPATLQVSGVAPGVCTLMWLGDSREFCSGAPVLPLDLGFLGAPGCSLLAEPIHLVAVQANAGGVATLPFQVPVLPAALPMTIFGQAGVVDAAANPFGGAFTRGMALNLQ
jgi:hypothetical protein